MGEGRWERGEGRRTEDRGRRTDTLESRKLKSALKAESRKQKWDGRTARKDGTSSLSPEPILKGFQHLAQGCAPRATLGAIVEKTLNPERIPRSQNSRIEPRNPRFVRKSLHGNCLGGAPCWGFLGRVGSPAPLIHALTKCDSAA